MRLSVRTFAAMLIGLALAAPQIDSEAQSRSSKASSSRSYSRGSGSSDSAKRQESRSSGSVGRTDKNTRPSSGKADISPALRNPSSGKPSVNRPSGNKPPVKPSPRPDYKPGKPHRPSGVRPPSYRPVRPHRPPVYRPRPYRPSVYVRPVIIRPSYGTIIAADIAATMAWTAVNIAYFNTVARTYDQISDNAQTIAQQNAVIAQNNSVIAAQNQAIVQSQTRAQEAYGLANGLGLVQSYADAGASYFYQDGVFYVQGADGQYHVIVPPAGALVEALPEDFETVTLDGNEYYKVDNTIYRMVINEGKPYFEVVGQMN